MRDFGDLSIRNLILILILPNFHRLQCTSFPFDEIIPPLGKIEVFSGPNKTELLAEFDTQPKRFSVGDTSTDIEGYVYHSVPTNACDFIFPPPIVIDPIFENQTVNWILLVATNTGCNYETKILNANAAGFGAVIIYNVESNRTEVIPQIYQVPAFFVGEYDGVRIRELHAYPTFHYVKIAGAYLFWGKFRAYGVWVVSGVALSILATYFVFLFVRGVAYSIKRRRSCGVCKEILPRSDGHSMLARLCILPCSHKFHAFCMMPYSSPTGMSCPICSKVFNFDSHISNSFEEPGGHSGSSGEINASRVKGKSAPFNISPKSDLIKVQVHENTSGKISSGSGSGSGSHRFIINVDSERQPLLLHSQPRENN